jgi:hypothetical protein
LQRVSFPNSGEWLWRTPQAASGATKLHKNFVLTDKLKRFTAELNQLNAELQNTGSPDLAVLSEFRQAVDNLRLTAWSTSEQIHSRNASNDPNAVVTFLIGERLRRFEQMVNALCADFDRNAIPQQEFILQPLVRALYNLQLRIKRRA